MVVVACGGGCRGGDGGYGIEMMMREVVWWCVGDGGEAIGRGGYGGDNDEMRAAKVAAAATGGRNVEEEK
nr:hypothetical protein [Tanacetum cinerariifolium]